MSLSILHKTWIEATRTHNINFAELNIPTVDLDSKWELGFENTRSEIDFVKMRSECVFSLSRQYFCFSIAISI